MAIIQCPSCGEQVSDRAKTCVHCGKILIDTPKKLCVECGAELEAGAIICSKCGCPIEEGKNEEFETQPQQVEITKVKVNKKPIIIALVVIVAGVIAAFAIKKVMDQRAAEKAAEEAAQLSEEYGENLESITYLMLDGAADAETAGNLIKSVWYNSIYEERDSTTDKYTRTNNGTGIFYEDFNDALGNLWIDSDFISDISDIEDNQEQVSSMMKDMKNPPEEWEDAYEDLQDYYDAYVELTNLVVNPTGSLQTFSESFNDADTAVSNCYSKMKLYFN